MTATLPRSNSKPPTSQSKPKYDLSAITSVGKGLPNRYLLHAVRGWGKTSLAAQLPNPIFIPTEDGLAALIDNKQIKDTPAFPQVKAWEDLLGYVDALVENEHSYKALVIDVMDGCETLCHQFVCDRDYGGNWGNKGFTNIQQGYTASLPEWRNLLNSLDRLRQERKMGIFILCHTKIKTFKNPLDTDYDRYVGNVHEATWALTADWVDAVLFGNYEVMVRADSSDKKGKGIGGQERILYAQHHAAYDAKNRLGLPSEIVMGNSPAEAWNNFVVALKAGREAGNVQQ